MILYCSAPFYLKILLLSKSPTRCNRFESVMSVPQVWWSLAVLVNSAGCVF